MSTIEDYPVVQPGEWGRYLDPWETRILATGYIAALPVKATMVPRAFFLAVIERLLDDYRDQALTGNWKITRWDDEIQRDVTHFIMPSDVDWLAGEVLPVAWSMDRFPMSTWMHDTRGCGCIVGEYLVAARVMNNDLDPQAVRMGVAGRVESINNLLNEAYAPVQSRLLFTFGNDIDTCLRDAVTGALDGGAWESGETPAILVFDRGDAA